MISQLRIRTVVAFMLLVLAVFLLGALACGRRSTTPSVDPGGTPTPPPGPLWSPSPGVSGLLQVSFVDVGQGDSIYLHASDGTDILIDGGPRAAGPTVVAHLQEAGIDDIEVLILTHDDFEHVGGLIDVLRSNVPVESVLYPNICGYPLSLCTSPAFQEIMVELQRRGLTPTPVTAPQTYTWGAINASVLNPIPMATEQHDENSLVVLVVYGDVRFLFTADVSTHTERILMDYEPTALLLPANILKVAKHGSGSGSSAAFLEAVGARVAVISVGATNPYGDPAQETLDRLAAAGAWVLRTDQHGTIVVTTDGETFEIQSDFVAFLPLATQQAAPAATPTGTPAPPDSGEVDFLKLGDGVADIAVAPNGEVWVGTFEYGEENFVTPVSYGTGVARLTGPAGGPGDERSWTTYTTADGLASNWVGAIAVTPDGVVWFGTSSGATRFIDRVGGTGDQALRAEPQVEAWTTFTTEDGLAKGNILAIAVAPDGAVWFGGWGGVSCFESADGTGDGAWTAYTTEDGLPEDYIEGIAMVEDIAVAPNGDVWVATRNNGVSRLIDPAGCTGEEAWITYTSRDGLADESAHGIAVAPDGTVWAGTHYGVSRFTEPAGDGGKWTTYTTEHGLADSGVRSIVVAPDGTVWVSYYGWTVGLSRFNDPAEGAGGWTTISTADGLPSNSVNAIAVGPDSALWVSTGAGTLSRFADPVDGTSGGEAWTTWTMEEIIGR